MAWEARLCLEGWTWVEQGSQWPEEGWGQVDDVSLEQLSSYWALHLVFQSSLLLRHWLTHRYDQPHPHSQGPS